MDYQFFIGIDVSKDTLDFVLLKSNSTQFHLRTENTLPGLRQFWKHLRSHPDFTLSKAFFCLEHTGIYSQHLLSFLFGKGGSICLESAIRIKRSGGLQRGKNDQVDALRIAQYALKNHQELRLWHPKREVITRLKNIMSVRSRLLNVKKQLSTPCKEAARFDKGVAKESLSLCRASLHAIERDLKKVEAAIDELIQSDEYISRLFRIVTSVEGVGKITATAMLVCTNEFKDIREASKFACYSGIAPFEHSSGSSIRGRSRVSHQANKAMKTLLHLAAMTAICYNQDMKNFYQRKLAENKNRMSILNAVRNKLVQRVFACVQQDRLYEKKYSLSLA